MSYRKAVQGAIKKVGQALCRAGIHNMQRDNNAPRHIYRIPGLSPYKCRRCEHRTFRVYEHYPHEEGTRS